MPLIRALLLTVILLASAGLASAEQPNIVVIIADDLGYGELGCYGGKEIPTPNLDRLAASGVRFTNGYVTAPMCAASRAGLLTGRYQTRFGFEFNPIGAQNMDPAIGLPPGERTYADRLRDAGYATALIGKWHLGGTARYHPERRGFDEFFGFLHEGHSYLPRHDMHTARWVRRKALPAGATGRWTSPDGRTIWSSHLGHNEPDYDADNPILRSSQPVNDGFYYLTADFTTEAGDFIRRHRDQPFCLTLSYNAVHSPLQANTATVERFAHLPDVHRRIFAALLYDLDQCVGGILDTLRETGLEKRTLVFFLSDNGGPTRELTSSNAPLRGGKMDLYEGGIRVPFLFAWPGRVPAGKVDDRVFSTLDLQPTMLAAAGAAPAAGDGMDLLPFLQEGNTEKPRDALFWRMGRKAALRADDWKLVRNSPAPDSPWELYRVRDDAGEQRNLAAEQPEELRRLVAQWEAMDAAMVAPLWQANSGRPSSAK